MKATRGARAEQPVQVEIGMRKPSGKTHWSGRGPRLKSQLAFSLLHASAAPNGLPRESTSAGWTEKWLEAVERVPGLPHFGTVSGVWADTPSTVRGECHNMFGFV